MSEYNGKSLNASSSPTDIVMQVKHPKYAQLQKWYTSASLQDHLQKLQSLASGQGSGDVERSENCMNLAEMQEDADNNNDIKFNNKAQWYKVSGYCTFFNHDDARPMYYLACSVCKKKVSDEPGGYRCEKCQKSFGEAVPTYSFAFMFSDYSGKVSVQCLGEVGESITGVPAIALMQDAKLA